MIANIHNVYSKHGKMGGILTFIIDCEVLPSLSSECNKHDTLSYSVQHNSFITTWLVPIFFLALESTERSEVRSCHCDISLFCEMQR